MSFVWFIIIGLVAGWLANVIMHGKGRGLFLNILIGVIGGVIGGWGMDWLNINIPGRFGSLVTAFLGAVVLLAIINLVNKKADETS